MAGVTGVTGGVRPAVLSYTDPTPEATAEERLGGPANPAHGNIGETATPYPWEAFEGPHGPYGLDNGLLGVSTYESFTDPASALSSDPMADLQPVTHAAPWPRGIPGVVTPDGTQEWNAQAANIHAESFGAARKVQDSRGGWGVQDNWQLAYDVDPGQSIQVPIPGQVQTGVAGAGSTDRVQSMAAQNEYGFDSAHMVRRYAAGSIPGNYQMLIPGSRPLVRSTLPQNLPIGEGPFAGQDGKQGYDTQGSALTVLPAPYSPAPDPTIGVAFPESNPEVSFW